jgi:hypothetical protein
MEATAKPEASAAVGVTQQEDQCKISHIRLPFGLWDDRFTQTFTKVFTYPNLPAITCTDDGLRLVKKWVRTKWREVIVPS